MKRRYKRQPGELFKFSKKTFEAELRMEFKKKLNDSISFVKEEKECDLTKGFVTPLISGTACHCAYYKLKAA